MSSELGETAVDRLPDYRQGPRRYKAASFFLSFRVRVKEREKTKPKSVSETSKTNVLLFFLLLGLYVSRRIQITAHA